MDKKDQILLSEAYQKVISQQQIEEGLWDRMKAQGASAVGAVKSIGDRAKGYGYGLQAAARNVIGDRTGATAAQAKSELAYQTSSNSSKKSKIDSFLKSKNGKIASLVQDIINDMNKLGLVDPSNPITEDLLSKEMVEFLEFYLSSFAP
jgi:hypothetical protein